MTALTQEQRRQRAEAFAKEYKKVLSVRKVAKALSIGYGTAQKAYRDAIAFEILKEPDTDFRPNPEAEQQREEDIKARAREKAESAARGTEQRLREEVNALRRKLKGVTRDNMDAAEVREAIFRLAAEPAAPPDWTIDPRRGSGVTGVPTLLCSDWHIGEVVRPAEVSGVNSFDLDIARVRIKRLVERTVDLCFNHMTHPEYPGIVVPLGGDMISGELHPEHAETNEVELFPSVLWTRSALIWTLSTLADHFKRVYVPAVPGNHGRDPRDRRPRSKRYVYRNLDWLTYSLVEQYFKERGDTRIHFDIPDTGEAHWPVYDHRYMLVHGDDLGVKGGDGIIGAIGPIMRGEIKMHHSQAQIGQDYDTLLMGHWHQILSLPRAIVNNCLKGYDEYARRVLRAPATLPSQALWFTNPKYGITARWEVFLEGEARFEQREWTPWED